MTWTGWSELTYTEREADRNADAARATLAEALAPEQFCCPPPGGERRLPDEDTDQPS